MVIGLSSLLILAASNAVADAETLITAQEAALPAAADTALATRGVTRGPKIELASPAAQGGTVKSPVDLKLKFQSFGGTAVDPDSVKVTYLKQPAVDLTPRLRKYIKPGGIEMPSAELPPGQHELRVSVKDSDGRTGTTPLKLVVGP
ncbi:MAG: hypothetical protein JSS04_15695 [Proteobacteria bacterium]|nr:hypothetical protein [Pseudomonadota bacterium]